MKLNFIYIKKSGRKNPKNMSGKINAFILTTVDRRADISLIKNLKA
jgi:hypothetical protein